MKKQESGIRDQGPENPQGPDAAAPTSRDRVPHVSILRHGNPQRWSTFIGPIVILLAAGVAVAPLLLKGDSCGHDFDFHLVSWFDALNAWQHGIPYPHWTASANYGAGEPRFVFYSPLTWMMGAALGSVLPWTLVPAALTFLLLAGTGLATRALAREALEDSAATLAGCVALFSGYALFTAYERSAFAELAGGFWIPLVLLYALRDRNGAVSDSQNVEQSEKFQEPASGVKSLSANSSAGLQTGCTGGFLAARSGLCGPGDPHDSRSEERRYKIRSSQMSSKAHTDSSGLLLGLRPRPTARARFSSSALPSRGWRRAFDGSAALLAVAVAGAWLSNPTVGVMACYLVVAVALARTVLERSWTPLLRASASAALGIGLIAIYLVPAAWEQRWVDIHKVTEDPGQTLENNWLFAVHADPLLVYHDQVLHTASVVAVTMVAVALGGMLLCWLRGRLPGARGWWIPLALVPAAVLLLQFPFSRPLWNLLPEMRFLQFPWRWLEVLEAPMGLFVAAALWPGDAARRWRRIAMGCACAAVFVAITAYAAQDFYQVCDDEDAVTPMLNAYRAGQGFIGTYEYEPIGADNSEVATGLPQACLVSDPAIVLGKETDDPDAPPVWDPAQGSCEATFGAAASSRPEHLRIVGTIEHAGYLVLRLRSYPAWLVRVNGRAVSSLSHGLASRLPSRPPARADGLMAVPVPQGEINLTVDWLATPDVILSRWLSGLSVLLLTGLYLIERALAHLS